MNPNKVLTASKKILAAVTVFFTLNSLETNAQSTNQMDNDNMVALLTRYEVKPEFQQVFRKAISDYVLHANAMDDNIFSEGHYEQDKPSVLWMIERWSDKAAFEKFRNNQFSAIDSLSAIGLLQPGTTIDLTDLEPLSKEQWRTAKRKDDRPITIMLFVDSKPGTQTTFENVYHTAMPAFRSEPGVINYQLSRFKTDSTRFVTYEKFRNEAAFQYHLKFPPIQPVIDYLNTSIKKQPFQDGIHTLIEFAPVEIR